MFFKVLKYSCRADYQHLTVLHRPVNGLVFSVTSAVLSSHLYYLWVFVVFHQLDISSRVCGLTFRLAFTSEFTSALVYLSLYSLLISTKAL